MVELSEIGDYIREKKKLIKRDKVCKFCGCNLEFVFTIDHIKPKIRGGEDIYENKQIACYICNQLKGPLTDNEFREYLKALKILYGLGKITIELPSPKVIFNERNYPKYRDIMPCTPKKEETKDL